MSVALQESAGLDRGTREPVFLDRDDKRFLLRAARIALENYFAKRRVEVRDFAGIPRRIASHDPKIFVTIYCDGKSRGCKDATAGNMLASTLAATRKAAQDDRLGERIKRSELSRAYLDITVMLDGEPVDQAADALAQEIELGVDSVSIERGGQRAFFKSSVPIQKNYSLGRTMARLSRKAGLDPQAYRGRDVTIKRYPTIQFAEDLIDRFTAPDLVEYYRGTPIVRAGDVDRARLEQALRLASGFFKNHVTRKGRLTYEYDPKSGERTYSNASVAVLRRLASTWAMAESAEYLGDQGLLRAAKRSTEYLIANHLRTDEQRGFAYLAVKEKANVGAAGFLLSTLVTVDEPEFYSGLAHRLGEFILAMEDREGGFLSASYLPQRSDASDSKHHYYPGEAMTGLMKLYAATGDDRYADLVARVFPFYRSFYRSTELQINMAAWMSKPYAALFEASGDRSHAEFVLEINDMVVGRQYGEERPHVDTIGGFARRGGTSSATGVFLESIAEGLSTARRLGDEERVARYSKALKLGMRFMLQAQYKPNELRQRSYAQETLGGFRTGFFDPLVRIDNVQHCALAILKALEHRLMSYC